VTGPAADLAMLARHEKIRTVPCPACGAAAGERCVKRPSGIPVEMPHQARRSAAADAGAYKPGQD